MQENAVEDREIGPTYKSLFLGACGLKNAVEDREIGPTYKSLFLGACGLISLAFGWWFTGFISAYDTLTARVAALEVRDTETKWTFRINAEKLNTHEDRLRALEREPDQRKRVGTE